MDGVSEDKNGNCVVEATTVSQMMIACTKLMAMGVDVNTPMVMSGDAEGNSYHTVDIMQTSKGVGSADGVAVIIWPNHDHVDIFYTDDDDEDETTSDLPEEVVAQLAELQDDETVEANEGTMEGEE